jgi:Transposase DDE domain
MMTQDDDKPSLVERLDEDWQIVERALPAGWQAKARELGALQRTRGIKDASHLLRVMLIHLADGCGLRETATRARLAGLAEISDVAILKRLKGCGAWFEWMIHGIQRQLKETAAPPMIAGHQLRIVDGTMVSEPGETGSKWRLHYSVSLPDLHCDQVILTTPKEGETLKRYTVNPGDILMADRGYAHPLGIAHVVDAGGGVIIRANLVTMPLVDRDGRAFDILANLRTLGVAETGDWMVAVKAGKRLLRGRLCAIKKSAAAAKKGQQRVARESQRGGHRQLQPQTLEAATYVFVFTTLGGDYSAARVLDLYRARWQIELTFKRLKSLVTLGHLKKHDDTAARTWLQGKLLVAFLIDRLLAMAERVSPWGYPFEEGQTQSLRVAGNGAHA